MEDFHVFNKKRIHTFIANPLRYILFVYNGCLYLINIILGKTKGIAMVEGGSTFVGDIEHYWLK